MEKSLDPRWLRVLIRVLAQALVLLALAFFALSDSAVRAVQSQVEWAAVAVGLAFALLLCAYYAWMLLARLQCSLLELWIIMAVLGIVEGLLLSTPGILAMGVVTVGMALLVAVWIMAGTVRAIMQARFFGIKSTPRRIGLFFLNWSALAGPAMALVGIALLNLGSAKNTYMSGDMTVAAVALASAGLLATGMGLVLESRARRVARRLLETGGWPRA